jgi:hypothetical protein
VINSLILIKGNNIDPEALRGLSLTCVKQIVLGEAPEMGFIVHISAESPDYFKQALKEFSKLANVSGVATLVEKRIR